MMMSTKVLSSRSLTNLSPPLPSILRKLKEKLQSPVSSVPASYIADETTGSEEGGRGGGGGERRT